MTPKNELRALTGLRGVAAGYVVFHHSISGSFVNPARTFLAHGYLAVDLFFVLSGFVMAMNYAAMFSGGYSSKKFLRFLGRRVARIYPMYIVATLAGFILTLHHHTPIGTLALAGLANIVLVQEWGIAESFDTQAWSISAEWAAYLAFPLLLSVTAFASLRTRLLTVVASVAAIIALAFLPPMFHGHNRPEALLDIVSPTWCFPEVRCLAEFSLGILSYYAFLSARGQQVSRSALWSTLLSVAIVGLLFVPRSDIAIVMLIPPLIVSLGSENHFVGRMLGSRAGEFLGQISYSIYLVHLLLLGGVRKWVLHQSQHVHLPHAYAIATGVAILVNVPIAYAAYRLIEVPSRQWLRSVFERGSASKTSPVTSDASSGR